MNTQKGFTIIELIVVIAIIAVLASIVLINVTGYINKGKDAAIKGNLSALITNAASDFDTAGHYNGLCAARFVAGKPIFDAITTAGGTALACGCNTGGSGCTATSTAWCAIATLKSGNKYCVDSAGNKIDSATVTCPAAGVCT